MCKIFILHVKCDLDTFSPTRFSVHADDLHTAHVQKYHSVVRYSEHSHKIISFLDAPKTKASSRPLLYSVMQSGSKFSISKWVNVFPSHNPSLSYPILQLLKELSEIKRAKRLDLNQAAHLLLIEEHNSPLTDTRKGFCERDLVNV